MIVDDEQSVLGYLLLVKAAQELRSEVGETFNRLQDISTGRSATVAQVVRNINTRSEIITC